MVESNRLLIYRTMFCTQGSNPCFSFVNRKHKKIFDILEKSDTVTLCGIVVQLVRAPPCHGGSCEFESRRSRFIKNVVSKKKRKKFHPYLQGT